MRTDYALYIAAVICFIIAAYGVAYPFTEATANWVIVVVLAIIGIIFIWGGYSLRPATPEVTRAEPSPPSTKSAMEEQPPTQPEPEPVSTPPPPEPEPMAVPEPGKAEEMPTTETTTETPPPETKPTRRRRERKKA